MHSNTVEQKEQLRSEGRTCRERQARSKASDVVLTLSSASTACVELAVARAKVPLILRPFSQRSTVRPTVYGPVIQPARQRPRRTRVVVPAAAAAGVGRVIKSSSLGLPYTVRTSEVDFFKISRRGEGCAGLGRRGGGRAVVGRRGQVNSDGHCFFPARYSISH
ncbi:hypothetical protein TYRP_003870 [Tyrophagus putrescentiae]|nr:hypothetical protein TYRP_003870 [Tyrophagus putrescentiae]